MKAKINAVTTLSFIFIFLILLSGSIGEGIVGNIIYYLAFLFPIFAGLMLIREFEMRDGKHAASQISITITKEKALLIFPAIAPSIAIIAAVSYVTSLIMNAAGHSSSVEISDNFALAILVHAIFPAVAEELLFRFIPLRLMGENKKNAIIVSSLLFSFAHANLFQIPYAFIAGVIFAVLDIYSESIIPSVLIHFLNNTVSLIIIFKFNTVPLIILFLILVAISLLSFFLLRNRYADIRDAFSGRLDIKSIPMLLFLSISLLLAITSLL